jgi:heat shock protein HslJ
MGNDRCNEYFGDISQLTQDNISFELLGRTKKLCEDMSYANSFYDTMKEVRNYRLEGLYLCLLNSNDEEIIKLLKVD